MMNTAMNTMTFVNDTMKAFESWVAYNDLNESEIKRELKRVFPGVKFLGINYSNLYTRNGYTLNYVVALIHDEAYYVPFFEYNSSYDQDSDEYLYR